MAVVTVYQHGIKAGVPPEKSDHQRAKRKKVNGWTAKSARSNVDFLRSVTIEDLDGLGHAVTLTVRTCPPSARAWDEMRDAWVKRLKRAGMLRLHWVTEWQARGVPHLHGVVFFEWPATMEGFSLQRDVLVNAWLAVCEEYEGDPLSQHVTPMETALGWLQYLAKHASRGADHYQRSNDTIPESWRGSTGRLWGKSGEWPTRAGMQLEIATSGFWELRRAMQRYRLADARSEPLIDLRAKRVRSARRMLQTSHRGLCETRGFSEWIPEAVQMALIRWISEKGHTVLG